MKEKKKCQPMRKFFPYFYLMSYRIQVSVDDLLLLAKSISHQMRQIKPRKQQGAHKADIIANLSLSIIIHRGELISLKYIHLRPLVN